MTMDPIEALLPGPLDVAFELATVLKFPIVLRPIERKSDGAPDYLLEFDGAELGSGWSRISTVTGTLYIPVLISHPSGVHLTALVWQPPEPSARWVIQVRRICEVVQLT